MHRILQGVLRFQHEIFPQRSQEFLALADRQTPRALFITCADSRVVPDLITQSEPGDMFINRNVGNIVPAYGVAAGGVSATIEYAVQALQVSHVIVCGHTHCGAMKAILHPETAKGMPMVEQWIGHSEAARQIVQHNYQHVSEEKRIDALTEENVILQLDHLKTHPSVAARLTAGTLQLHGWIYSIETGDIRGYDAPSGRFLDLAGEPAPNATPASRLRCIA